MAWKIWKNSETISLKYTLFLTVLLLLNIMLVTEILLIARMGLNYLLCKLVTLFFNFESTMKLHKYTLEVQLSWLYFTV